MAMELKPGQMDHNLMVNMLMVRNMEKVNLLGVMGRLTMGLLMRIKFRVKVSISFQTEENMKGYGSTIRWRGMECSHGQTAGDMRVTSTMIRKRGRVFSYGLMAKSTMVDG